MESLIAETMAKRKYEIEQLQGIPSSQTRTESESNLETKPKTKSINKKTEKTVSFSDNVTYEHINDNEDSQNKEENIINMNNIFSKLKKNQSITHSHTDYQLEKEKEKENYKNSYEIKILEGKIYKISKQLDIMMEQITNLLNKNEK